MSHIQETATFSCPLNLHKHSRYLRPCAAACFPLCALDGAQCGVNCCVLYCRCDQLRLCTLWFVNTLVVYACGSVAWVWKIVVVLSALVCIVMQKGCFGCGTNDSWRTSRHNGCVHENPIHQKGWVRPLTGTICLWMSAYQQNHPPSLADLC